MGARQKLNSAYVNGAILMAVVFGFATQSFLVAFCVFGLFVGWGAIPATSGQHPERGGDPRTRQRHWMPCLAGFFLGVSQTRVMPCPKPGGW